MKIDIIAHDRRALPELLGSNSATSGQSVRINDDLSVTWHSTFIRKEFGVPEIMSFTVDVASNIPAAVAADLIWRWLSSRLKKRPEKVVIERTEVVFEEGAVKRVITERMTKE